MRELVRLRQRFILILMLSVGLVLTIALVVNVVTSYSSQYQRIQKSLLAAVTIDRSAGLQLGIRDFGGGLFLEFNADPNAPLTETDPLSSGEDQEVPPEESRQESLDMVPVYVVTISGETGEVTTYGNSADIDEATLGEALSRVLGSTDESGLYLDLELFYMQKDLPSDGIRIAFADASHIASNTLNQALVALLVWIVAMVAFFIVGMILSRMVLKPVELAWTKQREFVADASHELKTPLTIILANNNIVMAHPEKTTEDQWQWLESTQEEASRMDGLITDLLLLAQIEHVEGLSEADTASSGDDVVATSQEGAGSKGADPLSRVDVSALMERSLLQFDAVFFERGIAIESSVETGLHTKGNPEHLRRLINILLDNASKYGNKGGMVEVRLAKSSEKPRSALLTVKNTGAFIPPEKIERVFDRFYRGDAAHSSIIEGSGLGLALAQEIVHEHKGAISITSVPLRTSDSTDGSIAPEEQLAETTLSVVLPLLP